MNVVKTHLLLDWLEHPQTEEFWKMLKAEERQRFEELLQACEKTTDPNVMRAKRNYAVVCDFQTAMKGLRRAEPSDPE